MLQETLRTDMVTAMKAKDALRLSVLRGLLTMCMQELTATKRTPQDTLKDEEVLALIRRARKQREDAAQQFRAGNRPELAEKEDTEAQVLAEYLPPALPLEEVERIVAEKITSLQITDKTGMGKLMGAVMAEVNGRAEGTVVKGVIERALGSTS